jgi:hypothetical protein
LWGTRCVDDQEQATKAHFEFTVNTKGGGTVSQYSAATGPRTLIHEIAIYGMYLDNPRTSGSREWYGLKKYPELALLPRLRALSDILWGFWVRANPNVKNIRYFFMLGISNEQTQALIASCLKNAKKELSAWPGVSFTMDSDEGHALLGTYIHT